MYISNLLHYYCKACFIVAPFSLSLPLSQFKIVACQTEKIRVTANCISCLWYPAF